MCVYIYIDNVIQITSVVSYNSKTSDVTRKNKKTWVGAENCCLSTTYESLVPDIYGMSLYNNNFGS